MVFQKVRPLFQLTPAAPFCVQFLPRVDELLPEMTLFVSELAGVLFLLLKPKTKLVER